MPSWFEIGVSVFGDTEFSYVVLESEFYDSVDKKFKYIVLACGSLGG